MNIIIVYEVKNREYDNALLLKSEFEKRNYKVEILCKNEMFQLFHKNAIVLIPNCYCTDDFNFYYYLLNNCGNILVNLQYEQVLSNKWEKIGFHNPKGRAKNVIHLCWGINPYNRLKNNGIKKEKLKITGAIQLDFLRDEFVPFFYNRNELAEKYEIPKQKKWVFYISSFTYVDKNNILNTEKLLKINNYNDEFINDFETISIKSQKITLQWFENLLDNNPEIIVIYRCHPMEKESYILEKTVSKYKNRFYCISELSVKQWILASDIITTWVSTSIIECYMAKKECYVLRPIKIPNEIDSVIYKECRYIENYSELQNLIADNFNIENRVEFPIDPKKIFEYYDIAEKPTYQRIVDEVEWISKNDIGFKEKKYILNRWIFIVKNHIMPKIILKNIYKFLFKNFNIKIKSSFIRRKFAVKDWEDNADRKMKNKEINEYKSNELFNIIRNKKSTEGNL